MNEITLRRAQMYAFLSQAFLYPRENWLADRHSPKALLEAQGLQIGSTFLEGYSHITLEDLQAEHRRVFGLVGSQCYETEFGLPHEFRQSQELADLAGFYQAFGFRMGGKVRERPDHIAVELEFMYLLCLKEAYARAHGSIEQAEITRKAQAAFLKDHLGTWIDAFAASLLIASDKTGTKDVELSPYHLLARLAADFVRSDSERLGVTIEARSITKTAPTPHPADLSCEDCPAAEMLPLREG
jgi:nitrate reductase assembly molybdenum cofactor insertion protein NarJ